MKNTILHAITLCVSVFAASHVVAQGMSYKSLNVCKKDYSEIFMSDEAKLEELPPGVYLARSVTQSFQKAGTQYFSYQTLLVDNKSSRDVCFTGPAQTSIRAQSFFPTLIDKTSENKWGHTFWSFNADLNKKAGAVDSTRSLIPNKDYKLALEQQGFKVTSHQKTHNEYQIKLVRDVASWKETVVISYDQF